MQKLQLSFAVGVLALAALAGAWFAGRPPPPVPVEIEKPDEAPAEATASSIVVHVVGAVESPGLVRVREGSRVGDAVMAAGGALGVADLGDLNLAASVSDGQQVVVPVRGSTQVEEGVGQGETKGEDGPIQLNEASAAELETLPGVGPVLAERIVAHREEHGPFASVEDLLDVPGIGEAKLAALRDLVVLP